MPRKNKAKEMVQEIINRTEELQKRYSDLHDRWVNDMKYYYGMPLTLLKDQTLSVLDPQNRLPVFNYVLPDVEIHTANMISSQPEMFVRGLDPRWDEAAVRLTDAVHAEWTHAAARSAFRRVCRQSSMMGTGLMDLRFRQPRGPGRPGIVSVEWLNPFEVLVDPHARRFEEARFVIICRYVTAQEAERLYPLMGAKIDKMKPAKLRDNDVSESIKAMTGTPYYRDLEGSSEPDSDSRLIRYIELWEDNGQSVVKVLGEELVEEEIYGLNGPETVTYPSRSPYDHGMFPFVPIYAIEDVFEPWGASDIYSMRDGQNHFNKVMQQSLIALDTLQTILTKMYVVPDQAGIDQMRKVANTMKYELISVDTPENIPKMVDARTLVEYVNLLLSMSQVLDKTSDDIGGISDSMAGVSQPRVYSGRHSMQLQAAAERRFAPRLDALTCSMQRIGEIMVSLIQQFYTDQLNEHGFTVGEGASSRTFRTHDQDGNPILPRFEDEHGNSGEFPGLDPRFEIYVQPQDEYPMARQAQSQHLVQSMQYGGADVESVVRTGRVPGGRQMVQRMGEKLLAGVDPTQPWPMDAVAKLAEKARADIDLTMMQQQLQRIGLQMQLMQAAQQMQQTGQMPPEQMMGEGEVVQMPMQAGQPPALPAEMAQEGQEMMTANVGQPPAEEAIPYA